MATYYCTPADIKTLIEDFSTSKGDSELLRIARLCGDQIDNATRNTFGKRNYRMRLSGDGTDYLSTAQVTPLPIVSVTTIEYQENHTAVWSTDETIDVNSYTVSDDRHGVLRVDIEGQRERALRDPIWVKGTKNYRLTGYFGQSYVPEAITWACVLLVRSHIRPGYSAKYEKGVMERFPDGYSIQRRLNETENSVAAPLTGDPVVDGLLRPYCNDVPLMIFPGS